MLLDRCEMCQDDDGVFRGIREPLPGGGITRDERTDWCKHMYESISTVQ